MYLRVLALGLMLFTSPALAQNQPVEIGDRTLDLVMSCRAQSGNIEARLTQCAAYLNGIVDANVMMSQIEGYEPVFCPPSDISGLQAIKIFVKWADEHPEQLHEHQRLGAIRSLLAAFPCD